MEEKGYLERSRKYKGFHYSILSPRMMEYLHDRTKEMLKSVVSIFDKNRVPYMICGGTLLGAVGAGRFIPWDDDIDLCVFESDYDRAMHCLTENLQDGMELQSRQTDPNYYLGWNKVRDQYSHCYPDAPKFKQNGVWIDIYRLRETEKSDVPYLIAKESIDYLDRRLAVGGLTRDEYTDRINTGKLYEKLYAAKKTKENRESSGKAYIIWSASKIMVESEWVLPLKTLQFEGMDVTTFQKPEEYLRAHYGNGYKIFPAEEDRRIGINRIDIYDVCGGGGVTDKNKVFTAVVFTCSVALIFPLEKRCA